MIVIKRMSPATPEVLSQNPG